MKLDVTQELYELDGETKLTVSGQICPVCTRPVDTGEVMTVRLVLTRALNFRAQNERLDFKEQMERYDLMMVIEDSDIVELSVVEAGKLQGLIAVVYSPTVTGQVGCMLEGE